MNDMDLETVSRMLEQADPSGRPGLKGRVWTRAIAPEAAPAFRVGRALVWAAPVAALATLLVCLQPRFSARPAKGPDSLYSLAPDWRAGEAFAAALPTVARQELPEDRESKADRMDRVKRANLDVEAMYWAWRVAKVKDVSFEQLKGYSRHWILKKDTCDEFFEKLQDILSFGKARKLTAEEDRRYTASLNEIGAILGTGPLGTPVERWPILKEVDRVDRETLGPTAKYWAWRIAGRKDVSYEELHRNSDHWIMVRATRDELFARIQTILDTGEARALGPTDREIFEGGRRRVRELLH